MCALSKHLIRAFGAIDFKSNNDIIDEIVNQLEQVKESLIRSDLNKFWLLYVNMVELLYNNLMAERCGLWDLYKYSLRKMLPYLAGTGRNNYTRSVFWFLQEMDNLNDEISKEFREGLFVVRRTGAFWSGVSPDLCIEQTLMAGLKGSTGLTKGRSLTEQSRLAWVLSRPAIAALDTAVKEMTGVQYRTFVFSEF